MRVTNRMVVDNALRRINDRQQKMDDARTKLSSGRNVRRLSDDPSAGSRVLSLRADERSQELYRRNAEDAQTLLNSTDDALQSLSERLRRVRDLAVAGANSQDPNSRDALATELEGVREQLRGIANERVAGRPLFSGFQTDDPFPADPTTGAVTFAGDDGKVERRLGDRDTVTVNLNGRELFGFGGGKDVFAVIDDLVTDVRAGNVDQVSNAIADVDGALDRVNGSFGTVGAASVRVTQALDQIDRTSQTLRGEISMVEDVSITDAVMELQMQEMAYQATLQATSRALPPSLVDFLR